MIVTNVLLLGGGLQGLSCGASLIGGRYVVDVVTDELQLRKSRFFNYVYGCGIKSLERILSEKHYDVVMPMSDIAVSFLSEKKLDIENRFGVKCACPDYGKLKVVEDKKCFMAFCDEHEIPHPKTAAVSDKNMFESVAIVGFPSLIKPDFSVGARGITKVNNIEELQQKLPAITAQFGTCTLQELIENEEYYYNVMLYRKDSGEYPAYAISKIVRMYPVHAGSSSCLVTVENDELLQICKNCLDQLDWVGMADFDVLQRLDNKEYKIIEINARVPASLRAASISGINFPEIIVLDTIGREIPHYAYNPGKTLRYMGIDMMWLMKSSKRFKYLLQWMNFFGKNTFYQDIYKNDFSTWWTWLAEGLTKIGKRNKRIR